MFGGIANWLGSLFGGNQQQKQAAPTKSAQPTLRVNQSAEFSPQRPSVDTAAIQREREEEERRRREAAAAKAADDARKKAEQEAKNKQAQELAARAKAGQQPIDTQANMGMKLLPQKPQVAPVQPVARPKVSVGQAQPQQPTLRVDNGQVMQGNGQPLRAAGPAAAPLLDQASMAAGSLIRGIGKGALDTPKALTDLGGLFTGLQGEFGAPMTRSLNQAGQWLDEGILGQGSRMLGQRQEQLTDEFNQAGGYQVPLSVGGEEFDPFYEVGQFLDPAGAVGATAALGVRGARALTRLPATAADDVGVITRLDENAERLRLLRNASDEVSQVAEAELSRLPTPERIDQFANDAAKLDDGIISPSRSQTVKQNLTQTVEQTRADIAARTQATTQAITEQLTRTEADNAALLPPETFDNGLTQADELAPQPLPTKPVAAQVEEVPMETTQAPAPAETAQIETPTQKASQEAVDTATVPVDDTGRPIETPNPEPEAPVIKESPEQEPSDLDKQLEAQRDANKAVAQQEAAAEATVENTQAYAKGKVSEKSAKGQKAAPKVAGGIAKVVHDSPSMRRAFESLGAEKEGRGFQQSVDSAAGRVTKMTDDEAVSRARSLRDIDMNNFSNVQDAASEAVLLAERLRLSSKAAEESGDLARIDEIVDGIDAIEKFLPKVSSNAGWTNGLVGFMNKMNTPMMSRVREEKSLKKQFKNQDAEVFTPRQKSEYEEMVADENMLYNGSHGETGKADVDGLNDIREKLSTPVSGSQLDELLDQKAALESRISDIKEARSTFVDRVREDHIKNGDIDAKDAKDVAGSIYGWIKTGMLSGPSGRIRDFVGTETQHLNELGVGLVKSLIGKTTNTIAGTNLRSNVFSTGKVRSAGRKQALKSIKSEFNPKYIDENWLGTSDADVMGRRNRSEIIGSSPRKPSLAKRIVHGTVSAPTASTERYVPNEMYKIGVGRGKEQGLKGQQLKEYGEWYALSGAPDTLDDLAKVTQQHLAMSGMQDNRISQFAVGLSEKMNKWADVGTDPTQSISAKRASGQEVTGADYLKRGVRRAGVRALDLGFMPFKRYPSGTFSRLTYGNLNPARNTFDMLSAAAKGNTEEAIDAASRLTVNSASTAAFISGAALAGDAVFSDVNENGKGAGEGGYPPYIKFGGEYIPFSSLPSSVTGPLSVAYGVKKYADSLRTGNDPLTNAYEATAGLLMATLQASGTDNLVSGSSPLNRLLNSVSDFQEANDKARAAESLGANVLKDTGTMLVPALSRDLNAIVTEFQNLASGEGSPTMAVDRKITDDEGKKKYTESALVSIADGVVGLKQLLVGAGVLKQSKDVLEKNVIDRVVGGGRSSDATIKSQSDEAAKAESTKNSLVGNEAFKGLLDDDQKEVLAKIESGAKVSESDSDEVKNAIISGAQKLIEKDDYDNYTKAKQLELDKLKNDPKSTDKKVAKVERDIKIAGTLKKNGQKYSLYQMYALSGSEDASGNKTGVSASELKDMLDPESEYYDLETASALLELDKQMTAAGLSANARNSKVRKYADFNDDGSKKKKAGSGRGGRGSGSSVPYKSISALDVMSSEDDGLVYRALKPYKPTISSAVAVPQKTNYKKTISVKRGVAL